MCIYHRFSEQVENKLAQIGVEYKADGMYCYKTITYNPVIWVNATSELPLINVDFNVLNVDLKAFREQMSDIYSKVAQILEIIKGEPRK